VENTISAAMFAEYCRIGLHAGLIKVESVHHWLDDCILDLDDPPYVFIEASLTRNQNELASLLAVIAGEANSEWAGEQLLGLLAKKLHLTRDCELSEITKTAMTIAKLSRLSESIYYEFDSLDENVYCCESGMFGTIQECRVDIETSLSRYSSPIFAY
jgi:hypothetical protein